LVYSLKIEGEEKVKDRNDRFKPFTEVYPKSDWNFALTSTTVADLTNSIELVENEWDGSYPWNLENAPIELRLTGVQLPEWKLVKSAPQLPANLPSKLSGSELTKRQKPITLIPYGCTTLRITEFPVVSTE
jgi:hypothetical protein